MERPISGWGSKTDSQEHSENSGLVSGVIVTVDLSI